MAALRWLGAFLGQILKAVLPTLIKEGKKPRDVRPAGFDKDLNKDMEDELRDQLNGK